MPEASSETLLGSFTDSEIQAGSRNSVGSGIRSGSFDALDGISLPESSPGIESLPDPNVGSPIVTVHRSMSNEEMEALSVGLKRARTPSSHSASRSSSQGKNPKSENGRSVEGQSSKKSSSERSGRSRDRNKNASSKISLSRPLNIKPVEPNKKVPEFK